MWLPSRWLLAAASLLVAAIGLVSWLVWTGGFGGKIWSSGFGGDDYDDRRVWDKQLHGRDEQDLLSVERVNKVVFCVPDEVVEANGVAQATICVHSPDRPDSGRPDTDRPDSGRLDPDRPNSGRPDPDRPDLLPCPPSSCADEPRLIVTCLRAEHALQAATNDDDVEADPFQTRALVPFKAPAPDPLKTETEPEHALRAKTNDADDPVEIRGWSCSVTRSQKSPVDGLAPPPPHNGPTSSTALRVENVLLSCRRGERDEVKISGDRGVQPSGAAPAATKSAGDPSAISHDPVMINRSECRAYYDISAPTETSEYFGWMAWPSLGFGWVKWPSFGSMMAWPSVISFGSMKWPSFGWMAWPSLISFGWMKWPALDFSWMALPSLDFGLVTTWSRLPVPSLPTFASMSATFSVGADSLLLFLRDVVARSSDLLIFVGLFSFLILLLVLIGRDAPLFPLGQSAATSPLTSSADSQSAAASPVAPSADSQSATPDGDSRAEEDHLTHANAAFDHYVKTSSDERLSDAMDNWHAEAEVRSSEQHQADNEQAEAEAEHETKASHSKDDLQTEEQPSNGPSPTTKPVPSSTNQMLGRWQPTNEKTASLAVAANSAARQRVADWLGQADQHLVSVGDPTERMADEAGRRSAVARRVRAAEVAGEQFHGDLSGVVGVGQVRAELTRTTVERFSIGAQLVLPPPHSGVLPPPLHSGVLAPPPRVIRDDDVIGGGETELWQLQPPPPPARATHTGATQRAEAEVEDADDGFGMMSFLPGRYQDVFRPPPQRQSQAQQRQQQQQQQQQQQHTRKRKHKPNLKQKQD